jgi:hypothetical protein
VVWKSPSTADRVVAVNQEFVYVRDRQGRLLVFDAHRATDPARRLALPLSEMNLAEFNVPVVNTASDRVFLAADNGLVVCLRDASAKYARPVPIAPPPIVDPPPKAAVSGDKPGDQPMGTPSPGTTPPGTTPPALPPGATPPAGTPPGGTPPTPPGETPAPPKKD